MPYANPDDRKKFQKAYNASAKYREMNNLRQREKRKANFSSFQTRQFVAIDSEGFTFGDKIEDDGKIYSQHKTFLWGAGTIEDQIFLTKDRALTSVEICEWLLSLPALFGPSIFVSFAFSYDASQIVADLPYEKALELQRGHAADDERKRKNSSRVVFWKNYGFAYLKGKKFALYKFDPKGARKNGKLAPIAKILIYDVFGFFQASFIKASNSMPGAVTPDDAKLIEQGKKARSVFKLEEMEFVKSYTAAELRTLARMMTLLREALAKQDLHLRNWFGAGSIAQAMLKHYDVKKHYPQIETVDLPEPQIWAHHAYFGGRIELCKQGYTKRELHNYDIASAYPAVCATLPAMRGGQWTFVVRPSLAQIRNANILSIVRVRTKDFPEAPFYPLPYRTSRGSIYFPRDCTGRYMRDEILAAQKWAEAFDATDKIEYLDMWEFTPAYEARPFAFLQELFDYRKSLSKKDITQIVIKLGINSVYGKQAQGVGGSDKPPPFANPWYAAAITAGTRARLLEAALLAPKHVVMMATDGLVMQKSIPLEIPTEKTLGAWEYGKSTSGGCFVQSGVYVVSDDAGKYNFKTRGFRPTNVEGSIAKFLAEKIPDFWRDGIDHFDFPYSAYMTLGAAVSSEKNWRHIGRWCEGVRTMDLESLGKKRLRIWGSVNRKNRARRLVFAPPSNAVNLTLAEGEYMPMSAPHVPEWLDAEMGEERALQLEQHEIQARFAED